jgi:hypothetical protein
MMPFPSLLNHSQQPGLRLVKLVKLKQRIVVETGRWSKNIVIPSAVRTPSLTIAPLEPLRVLLFFAPTGEDLAGASTRPWLI